MGCAANLAPPPIIPTQLQYVGVREYDAMFYKAKDILARLEKIRGGIMGTEEALFKMMNLQWLQHWDMNDILKIWLWSVSAENNANLMGTCSLEFIDRPPFIQADLGGIRPECYEARDLIAKWMETALMDSRDLPKYRDQLKELLIKLVPCKDKIKDEFAKAGLKGMDLYKAIAFWNINFEQMKLGYVISWYIDEDVNEAFSEAGKFIISFAGIKATADIYGKKAIDQKKKMPDMSWYIHEGSKNSTSAAEKAKFEMTDNKFRMDKIQKFGESKKSDIGLK